MANLFRPIVTKAVPANAERVTRKGAVHARWTDRRERSHTAPVISVDGVERIRLTTSCWYFRFRDADGLVQTVSTGCHDKVAAESVANQIRRQSELVKAKIMSRADVAAADHGKTPLDEHLSAYTRNLTAHGASSGHLRDVHSRLNRIIKECGIQTLNAITFDGVERWFAGRAERNDSAGNRNNYRKVLIAFLNWCVRTNRLVSNPLTRLAKANADADHRHQRRALTEVELNNLLRVAATRPLIDTMTVRRGKNRGQAIAKLRPAVQDQLRLVGRERTLIYKTLVLTGLRKGELASLTVGQLVLDDPRPYLVLQAADEKNRQGSDIPVRSDLVMDLTAWLQDKLLRAQCTARAAGEPIPLKLPASAKVFRVPAALDKILNRDLVAAGIARKLENGKIDKRDERGRVVDVHAMRMTLNTLLFRAGVTVRTAQEVMRHSDPKLTTKVYTDPKLLDVAGALHSLPLLPLSSGPQPAENVARATGTYDTCVSTYQFAHQFARPPGQTGPNAGKADHMLTAGGTGPVTGATHVSAATGMNWANLTTLGQRGKDCVGRESNPQPSASEADALSN